jgi:hypothetical protein
MFTNSCDYRLTFLSGSAFLSESVYENEPQEVHINVRRYSKQSDHRHQLSTGRADGFTAADNNHIIVDRGGYPSDSIPSQVVNGNFQTQLVDIRTRAMRSDTQQASSK